jgi:hypothetical protein
MMVAEVTVAVVVAVIVLVRFFAFWVVMIMMLVIMVVMFMIMIMMFVIMMFVIVMLMVMVFMVMVFMVMVIMIIMASLHLSPSKSRLSSQCSSPNTFRPSQTSKSGSVLRMEHNMSKNSMIITMSSMRMQNLSHHNITQQSSSSNNQHNESIHFFRIDKSINCFRQQPNSKSPNE